MSEQKVVPLRLSAPSRQPARCRAALIDCVAGARRFGDDVYWLKENAELLNILQVTGAALPAGALRAYAGFYDQIADQLRFFPQYYRFLLSICLDLEDLGLDRELGVAGDQGKGAALCHWAAHQGLADAELSDLQRAEARRLMLRRGFDPLPEEAEALTARLHCFADRAETFALPNRKAAYELTHVVFYLSDYGRRDPDLSPAALTSLEYAGLLAFLDRNSDLLAEICIALRYAGQVPSPIWEVWVAEQAGAIEIRQGAMADPEDCYHDWFVCNWALALQGGAPFESARLRPGPASFHRPQASDGALRRMSECLMSLGGRRCGDWAVMRPHLARALGAQAPILVQAEASSQRFAAFFEGFARANDLRLVP